MHPTDDVHARGSLAVARAVVLRKEPVTIHGRDIEEMSRAELLAAMYEIAPQITALMAQVDELAANLRALAASDAALARAIDAVPGRG